MGNCFLDVEGRKQAVGGVQHSSIATNNNNAGHNDAVEFFYRSWGLQQRFTRVELSLSAINLRDHDIISKTLELKDQDFLREATCVLSEVLTKKHRSLTLNLCSKIGHVGLRNLGVLTIHAEETIASRRVVEMMLHCSYLDNKDIFSKSDPFLRISRVVESGGSIPICKAEVVNNNLNPKWKSLCLSMQQFGSKDNPLTIECFDFNSSGKHLLIGGRPGKIHEGRSGANLTITSHHGHKKVLKGELYVDQFCEKEQYNFLDYVSCGFELNFMVAVDFTASNGNPWNPDSLHYIDPSGQLNSYQKFDQVACFQYPICFLECLRKTSLFVLVCFGGKTFDGTISHCFNLNGIAGSFEVEGVEGIMYAYASALHYVTLAGPTLFGQVIKTAAQIASQSVSYNSKKYFVLLIITDGVLTDLQEMKDALVKASDLPLSILIVGVGGADFGQMDVLDANKGQRLESSTDLVATRDIVQFVPMQDVHDGKKMFTRVKDQEMEGHHPVAWEEKKRMKEICRRDKAFVDRGRTWPK
ncbi:hypothetical protein I3842_08G171000 [Carya illinoinensis]|uniref:C2 domain-containing protein n=1 Tax=Carya illinoinensis TaxID=32201 RepID=A0A922EGZ0_CARIL|nr:hypothetical protein I3842_08G171000 [Carya illinoinensis]